MAVKDGKEAILLTALTQMDSPRNSIPRGQGRTRVVPVFPCQASSPRLHTHLAHPHAHLACSLAKGMSALRDVYRGQRPLFTSPIFQEFSELNVKQADYPTLTDDNQQVPYMWTKT